MDLIYYFEFKYKLFWNKNAPLLNFAPQMPTDAGIIFSGKLSFRSILKVMGNSFLLTFEFLCVIK